MSVIGETNPFSQPQVRLLVRGEFEREQTIEARLDTGFDLYLGLPSETIAALGLVYVRDRRILLADGTRQSFPEYRARVLWEGLERPVRVLAKPGDALAGVALFHGYRVCIEFIDGGGVEAAEIV